ncbi:MAG: hypothetical protein H0W64_10060 [Gammaproteobacteria bacterium]|nr:hypothetical protein [Gammaproteobacteria bacterium]
MYKRQLWNSDFCSAYALVQKLYTADAEKRSNLIDNIVQNNNITQDIIDHMQKILKADLQKNDKKMETQIVKAQEFQKLNKFDVEDEDEVISRDLMLAVFKDFHNDQNPDDLDSDMKPIAAMAEDYYKLLATKKSINAIVKELVTKLGERALCDEFVNLSISSPRI